MDLRRRARAVFRDARVLPWVWGPAALGLIVAALAVAAQHSGNAAMKAAGSGRGLRNDYPGPQDYPLFGHVAVMVGVGALAVVAAVGLVRAGAWKVAGLPLLAAAAGPMAIVAAPVRSSLISLRTGDTAGWWHLTVGAALLAILGAWTLGACRRMVVTRPLTPPYASPAFVLVVLTAMTALVVVAVAPEPEPTAPTGVPILAWSVLAASAAVVVMMERRRALAAAVTILAVGAVIGFPLAYRREGTGAAVPGWEFGGTSPVVLSTLLGCVVLSAVSVGVVLRVLATRAVVAVPDIP